MVKRSRKAAKVEDEDVMYDFSDSGLAEESDGDPSYCPMDGAMSGRDTPSLHNVAGGPMIPGKSRAHKKKLGRPASFQEEDIDWESLTPEERRKIRRRLSNRRSAHRVRQRRLEMMDTLQSKVEMLHKQQAVMIARLQEGEAEQEQLTNELSVARERWAATAQENMRLVGENARLRRMLEEAKIPIPTAPSLDLSQALVLQPDTLAAHLLTHATPHTATAAGATTTTTTRKERSGCGTKTRPASLATQQRKQQQQEEEEEEEQDGEVSNTGSPAQGPPLPTTTTTTAPTTMHPLSGVMPLPLPITLTPLPPPSGFAAVQPPMALAPPTGTSTGTSTAAGPPLPLPRGMLSDQLLTQFTLDLNRAYTLSLNLSDLDVAPSLGLNTLLDLGGMGGMLGGNNTLL